MVISSVRNTENEKLPLISTWCFFFNSNVWGKSFLQLLISQRGNFFKSRSADYPQKLSAHGFHDKIELPLKRFAFGESDIVDTKTREQLLISITPFFDVKAQGYGYRTRAVILNMQPCSCLFACTQESGFQNKSPVLRVKHVFHAWGTKLPPCITD